MYTYKLNKQPKNTVELVISIPKKEIALAYEKAFEKLTSTLTIEGFRKGKAPKSIAEKHISKEQTYKELINTLLPKIYEEIVKKENIKPVINPKIELTKAKPGEDWELKLVVAEKPTVTVGDYKNAVKKAKADEKKSDIWVPGKDAPKEETEETKEQKKQMQLNNILTAILKETKIEISDLIVEEELNQRLIQLVDDIRRLGLTTEAYLQSKKMTMEGLKEQYKKEILDTYKLEFALLEIADKENIVVTPEEIETVLKNIKDEKQRDQAKQNAYFYSAILRKQKTLEALSQME